MSSRALAAARAIDVDEIIQKSIEELFNKDELPLAGHPNCSQRFYDEGVAFEEGRYANMGQRQGGHAALQGHGDAWRGQDIIAVVVVAIQV